LRFCPCVLGRLTVIGQPAYIANANGCGIAPPTMRPDFLKRASFLNYAITANDIMIANLGKAPLSVPFINVFCAKILTFPCGGTMNDNFQ